VPDGPLTWFRLRNVEGKTRGWAFESRLLSTTLSYDPATDKFVEDPDFHYLNKVEVVAEKSLPPATPADMPRVPPKEAASRPIGSPIR
jgi:hypothetical protein